MLLGTSGAVAGVFSFKHGTDSHVLPCLLVATWYPEVVSTPDPAHGGQPVRGLAARVYLFGPEIAAPLMGNGSLLVDLYDECAARPNKEETPLPLEEWRLDAATLKRLQRRDAVGWGYTLFLPWGTYRPEITHVRIRLRYQPEKGTPLFNDSGSLVLRSGESSAWQTTDVPALKKTAATYPRPTDAAPPVPNTPAFTSGAPRR
jgi:hypothetical protein